MPDAFKAVLLEQAGTPEKTLPGDVGATVSDVLRRVAGALPDLLPNLVKGPEERLPAKERLPYPEEVEVPPEPAPTAPPPVYKAPPPVYVSSDSDEILDVAQQYGAKAIKRPAELATDTATSESALRHALDNVWGQHKEIVFLQVTAPLRKPSDVELAIEAFSRADADCLFSCCQMDDLCLWFEDQWGIVPLGFNAANRPRRQDRDPLYLENGSIYVIKTDLLRCHASRLAGVNAKYLMEPWQQYEIDDEETFDLCQYQFIKHKLHE